MNHKKINILLSVVISLLVVFIGITSVLLAKVIHMENEADIKVKTELSSEDLDAYLDGKYVKVCENVDPDWDKWSDLRYSYGFDRYQQPVFNTVKGVLESDTMISVRGGKGRWSSRFSAGGHVFEGWSGNELSRLTILMGKFQETFACIHTYSPAGLYEAERRFGWIKLGSDERRKGVDFSQGWTKFYTPLTLQCRKSAPRKVTDSDLNPQLPSARVPVGTMYYDITLQKVRVMTKVGWKSISFE